MEKAINRERKIVVEYTGLDKFLKDIGNNGRKFIQEDHNNPKISKAIGQRLRNTIFGDKPQKNSELAYPITIEQNNYLRLLMVVNEVYHSYSNLLDCAIYIRQYPNYKSYKKREITKTKYLRYHIEKYFEEMYILKTRIEIFLNIVRKSYKNSNDYLLSIDKIQKIILKPFEGIIDTRGRHTHSKRYEDEGLSRLELLELLTKNPTERVLMLLKDYKDSFVYREIRSKWYKQISTNNKAVEGILDKFFDCMHPLVFDKDGEFKENILKRNPT